ncbi:hypothetical protein ABEB36_003184 [Hypothenemus hampei]|uniref:Apple domain-containing protein n=1 Tax=Hypothenemus hampei TaxID=57062 RepID=A0ABD1F8A7_HYPHA
MSLINFIILEIFSIIFSVNSISFDSQLTLIKNDCYDRLAIGEKLISSQIYKSFPHNTVAKCEHECTKDKEKCRAYSFGIGPKGNASCLLSANPVKETVDLKPIGTIKDADFDLYIKKLDCQIILEPPHGDHSKPSEPSHHYNDQETSAGYHYNRPQNYPDNIPAVPHEPSKGDNFHHVQTLVSIASGPNSVLHPIHDILVAGETGANLAPYKPPISHQGTISRPPFPGYGVGTSNNENSPPTSVPRPILQNPYSGYGDGTFSNTPPISLQKPAPQNYYWGNQDRNFNGYSSSAAHYRPYPSNSHSTYGDDISSNANVPPYGPPINRPRPVSQRPNFGYESGTSNNAFKRPLQDNFYHTSWNYGSSINRRKYESINNHNEETHFYYQEPPRRFEPPYRPEPNNRYEPHTSNDYLFLRPSADYPRPLNEEPGTDEGTSIVPSRKPPSSLPSTSSIQPSSSTEISDHQGGTLQIVTENVSKFGEKVTSIITELKNACFRRSMAGHRTVRGLVRKLLICDTVEQCQQECGDERRFTCEGFNYRLDPSGRGKGECELLDLPISRINVRREILPDPDYDFYVRDRNAAQNDCRQPLGGFYSPGYGTGYYGGNRNRYDGYDRRPTDIMRPVRPPEDHWDDRGYGPPPSPPRHPSIPLDYGHRRGEYSFHSQQQHESHHYDQHSVDRYDYHQYEDKRPFMGIHYLPAAPLGRPTHPTRVPVIIPLDSNHQHYPPPSYFDKSIPDGPYGGQYGYNYHRYEDSGGYHTKPKIRPNLSEDWGLYGGSYGTGSHSLEYQGYGNRESYNYWGFNKLHEHKSSNLPSVGYDLENAILPSSSTGKPMNHFIGDECSLRSAAGFRLHKNIVKKLFAVPNIYECELLCVREKDFSCASYAFRYTIQNTIADNCFLSNRNYKELDYYTDLEQDRDFDIYTMNNRHKCHETNVFLLKDDSDCFWRVRSGLRLDHVVVRDSLTVKSIVDCQLECLKSRRFTCRAYSFRYGSPVIGGAIDNCQLTDWPYDELDPRVHFVPDYGFEIYDRGSYGHGCEVNHFGVRGHKRKQLDEGTKVDQLCYVGFGSASRLLPQATVKSVYVPSELDCKGECSKARENSYFRCMTFSFVSSTNNLDHNCLLSDILQRDLLPNVDYVHDDTSWLFSWDNYNPQCVDLAFKPLHNPERKIPWTPQNPLDVWKVYSVSGWPCRKGTFCTENKQGGFWYCELEGGGKDTWDYCCSPDHQCGFSNGYPYSWCYVGPKRTQWRKCNDQYYPYYNHLDRLDNRPTGDPGGAPPPEHSPGFRPDRPNAPVRPGESPNQSLDEYEQEFDNQFLSPPKPGGLGQPRRWPVAYLHKEVPPNVTDSRNARENSKLAAIKSLIDVIQNSEAKNLQFNVSNGSSNMNDVLLVKIPLPKLDESSNKELQNENQLKSDTKVHFETVDVQTEIPRSQKSLPIDNNESGKVIRNVDSLGRAPIYRRGFVTRTNVTNRSPRRILIRS